jgi:hypothetical protein
MPKKKSKKVKDKPWRNRKGRKKPRVTFRINIYPSARQLDYLEAAADVDNMIYTILIKEWIKRYKAGEGANGRLIEKWWRDNRDELYPKYMRVGIFVEKGAIYRAYLNFWKYIEKNGTERDGEFNIEVPQRSFYNRAGHVRWGEYGVRIPRLGWVKMEHPWENTHHVLNVWVVELEHEKWCVDITCEGK